MSIEELSAQNDTLKALARGALLGTDEAGTIEAARTALSTVGYRAMVAAMLESIGSLEIIGSSCGHCIQTLDLFARQADISSPRQPPLPSLSLKHPHPSNDYPA